MIYLGDNMASRMEKYHDKRPRLGKRSQRNSFLYDLLESGSLDRANEINITKLEGLFHTYEDYKYKHAKRQQIPIEKRPQRTDLYQNLKQESNASIGDISKPKPSEEQNIKELIHTITSTSSLKQSDLSNMKQPSREKQNIKKDNIESLFQQTIPTTQKKSVNVSKNYIVDEKEKRRKLNLRVKYISGILFIINVLIIIFLIYRAIK